MEGVWQWAWHASCDSYLQVTATCLSIVNSGHSHQNQRRESRLLSPPPLTPSYPPLGGGVASSGGDRPSQENLSLPQLEVVSEEDRTSDNVFEGPLSRGSGRNSSPRDQGDKAASSTPPLGGQRGSGGSITGSYSRQLSSQHCHHASFLQRQLSSDELAMKRTSPGGYYMGEEDLPVCEVWVATSNARHSTISVIDYAQKFTNFEVRTYVH